MQGQAQFFERLPDSVARLWSDGGVVLVIIGVASVIAWALLIAKWFGARDRSVVIDEGTEFARSNSRSAVSLWLSAERGRLLHGLGPVEAIAAMLPLLGLLGTVLGMLDTFAVIQVEGTGDPRLLADGIRQALVTTQAGILAVLPVLLIHRFLASRADKTANEVQVHVQRTYLDEPAEGGQG